MKLINRHNFIPIVCITFTLIVCGKLLYEKSIGFTDRYYTENIFASTLMHALFNFFGSGLLDLLKLKEFGVPAEVRSEIISWTNSICIMLMVPAGLAYLYLRHKTIKRKKLKAESVASVE